MKTFLVLNGTTAKVIEKENMDDAITFCQNFMDHSKEVIVREITNFQFKQHKSDKLVQLVERWRTEADFFNSISAKMRASMSELSTLNKALYEECHRTGISMKDLKLNG